jgi:hypothetical protein
MRWHAAEASGQSANDRSWEGAGIGFCSRIAILIYRNAVAAPMGPLGGVRNETTGRSAAPSPCCLGSA